VTQSVAQVEAMILGAPQAPWERGEVAEGLARALGAPRPAVLQLLQRAPAARPAVADFRHACLSALSSAHLQPHAPGP
jgi:hypothetical protein